VEAPEWWCQPPPTPRSAARMSVPRIAPTTPSYRDCNFGRLALRLSCCRVWRQLQAGGRGERPAFLADFAGSRMPFSKPAATSSIFDCQQRRLPDKRRPGPDLPDDWPSQGGECLTAAPSGSRRWRRPWRWPNGCSWRLGLDTVRRGTRWFARLGMEQSTRPNFRALSWNGEELPDSMPRAARCVGWPTSSVVFLRPLLGLRRRGGEGALSFLARRHSPSCFERFEGAGWGWCNGPCALATARRWIRAAHPIHLRCWTGINFGHWPASLPPDGRNGHRPGGQQARW